MASLPPLFPFPPTHSKSLMQHLNNNWTIEGLPRNIVKLIDSIQGEQEEGSERGGGDSKIVYKVLAAIIIAQERK